MKTWKRRNFLAIAGTILFGAPVFGDPTPLTLRDVITRPPERIGAQDVTNYEQTVTRLGVLDREAGGMAAREALAATAGGQVVTSGLLAIAGGTCIGLLWRRKESAKYFVQ